MKKLFTILVAGLYCICNATAQYNPTTNTYTLQDKDVTITNGIITACSTNATDWGTGKLIIPETLQGQTVLEIADGDNNTNVFGKKGIKELLLPASLLIVGSHAFRDNGLTVLIFHEKSRLKKINRCAFFANSLIKIVIPHTVAIIESFSFGMNKLTSVAFEQNSFLRYVTDQAFFSNIELRSITLPSNVNPGFNGYIKSDYQFVLEKNIDYTITDFSLRYYADIPIHTLTLDDVLLRNGDIVSYMGGYTKIKFPDNFDGEALNGIKTLFYGCMEYIELSNSIDTIINSFGESYINNITIPSNVKCIGNQGIGLFSLKNITFNENSNLCFIGEGGILINGTGWKLPTNIIKEGYVFTGWKNGTGLTVDSIKDNMSKFYAQFISTTSYTVSGKITSNNTAGLHLVLSGDFKGYRYTNSDGSFSFPLNAGRTMTLTPEKEGYTFTPASRTLTNVQAAASNLDFTATPTGTCVSGTIDIDDKNMWLQVSGDVTCTVKLNADGTYTLPLNIGRSVTIMPVKDGYVFTPQSIEVKNVQNCVSGINFIAKEPITQRYNISGKLAIDNISGVIMSVSGDVSQSLSLQADGTFSFDIDSNKSVTITPIKAGYSFSPTSLTIPNCKANAADNNFTAKTLTALTDVSEDAITLYPNPAKDKVSVECTVETESIELFTLNGTCLIQRKPQSESTMLDLRQLPQGVYLLKIKTANAVIERKIVKE